MFQPLFRTVSPLFPALFILLLPAGGCSLLSGGGEIPEEETQPRPASDSVMEEELQDLRRRVEVLENKLVPGSPVPPSPLCNPRLPSPKARLRPNRLPPLLPPPSRFPLPPRRMCLPPERAPPAHCRLRTLQRRKTAFPSSPSLLFPL